MRNNLLISIVWGIFGASTLSCNGPVKQQTKEDSLTVENYKKGSFGYDLKFLRDKDSGLVLLQTNDSAAQIIVSPKYQAKVFTSTATGLDGSSFGWVNYKAFEGPADTHMNAYGGEDRLWLGPEGGRYSLFFNPGVKMEFEQWHTPPAIDTEAWNKETQTGQSVHMSKTATLLNYAGTTLSMRLERTVEILPEKTVVEILGLGAIPGVNQVGFSTTNAIINVGEAPWDTTTGMPCLWSLDMFNPSQQCIIVIPFNTDASGKVATTDYFGPIASDRIRIKDGVLYFKADGKSRGKLGLPPGRAKDVAGSYDALSKVLTIIKYDVVPSGKYLNQEWHPDRPVFSGDAMNAYNDGPLDDGTQMGPFYELESVSPAAFLKPGEKLTHHHLVFHFSGDLQSLDTIATRLLGVSLKTIEATLQ